MVNDVSVHSIERAEVRNADSMSSAMKIGMFRRVRGGNLRQGPGRSDLLRMRLQAFSVVSEQSEAFDERNSVLKINLLSLQNFIASRSSSRTPYEWMSICGHYLICGRPLPCKVLRFQRPKGLCGGTGVRCTGDGMKTVSTARWSSQHRWPL